MIKAVIIDIDDTLCLTESACFDLENEIVERMGYNPILSSVHLKTWGWPLLESILECSVGVDLDRFKEYYHPITEEYVWAGRLDNISKESYDAIDGLINDGKKVVILALRTEIELRHVLTGDHLLAARIEVFHHKDNTNFYKPDSRVFWWIVVKLFRFLFSGFDWVFSSGYGRNFLAGWSEACIF